MSAEVLQFARRQQHGSGEAFCLGCGHDWVAVVPTGTMAFECPNCHRHTGHFRFEFQPADGMKVREWRNAVLERDLHTCRRCNSTVDLEAHHIVHWADEPMLRLVVENGITLCDPCHIEEHRRS